MYTLINNIARQRDVMALSPAAPEKLLGATVPSSLANAKQQRTIVTDVYLHGGELGLVRGAGSMIGKGYHRSLFSTLKTAEVEHQIPSTVFALGSLLLEEPVRREPGWPPELGPIGSDQEQTGPTFELERAKNFLSHGQIQEARQTVRGAMLRWPTDEGLSKLQRAISPARVVRRNRQYKDRRLEVSWIIENRQKYRGKWVALSDNNPVAIADDLKTLLRTLRERRLEEVPLIQYLD